MRRPRGVGNGNPLQYSCLGNPMRGAWRVIVHGIAKELDTTEQLNNKRSFTHSHPHTLTLTPSHTHTHTHTTFSYHHAFAPVLPPILTLSTCFSACRRSTYHSRPTSNTTLSPSNLLKVTTFLKIPSQLTTPMALARCFVLGLSVCSSQRLLFPHTSLVT